MAERIPLTTLEIEIPGDARYVCLVRKSVRLMAAVLGFQGDALDDIEVATAEAVTNAIIHGTPAGSGGRVRVRCRDAPGSLVVEVEDQGDGQKNHPQECNAPESEHGRGMYMIESLMDDTQMLTDECGTLVRMTKRIEESTKAHA